MFDVSRSCGRGEKLTYCFEQVGNAAIMLGADGIILLKSKRCEISCEIFLSLVVDLRKTVLRVEQKKENVGIVNSGLDSVANLHGQFRFTGASDTAGIPDNKWLSSARADSRDAVTRDSGLIMHDGDAAPNQSIKQGGFAYVRPADDRDVRQIIHGAVHRQDTGLRVFSRARALQPAIGARHPLRKPRQRGA